MVAAPHAIFFPSAAFQVLSAMVHFLGTPNNIAVRLDQYF
jgi:hypothetical protein